MKKVKQCWLYLNLRASFKILKITVARAVDWDKSVNIFVLITFGRTPIWKLGLWTCLIEDLRVLLWTEDDSG